MLHCRFLGSLAGGSKKISQQKEMAVDLSKFLRFASTDDSVDINLVSCMKAIEDYVAELQKREIGPSGIIAKLNVLCYAQTFILHR